MIGERRGGGFFSGFANRPPGSGNALCTPHVHFFLCFGRFLFSIVQASVHALPMPAAQLPRACSASSFIPFHSFIPPKQISKLELKEKGRYVAKGKGRGGGAKQKSQSQ